MAMGFTDYFVCDISCQMPLHPTMNGKPYTPLFPKEDVDAAKMQGKVAGVKVPAEEEAGVLEELVRDGEKGETAPDTLAAGRAAPPVEPAEKKDCRGNDAQPAEMEGTEVGEAHPGRDGIGGVQKVLHGAASGICNWENHLSQHSTVPGKCKGRIP